MLYQEIFASVGLQKSHLVCPVFVREKVGSESRKINSMPGISATSIDKLTDNMQSICDSGISSIIIFGIPEKRDATGNCAFDSNGVVQKSVRALRKAFGDTLKITTDVCVCQYNLSGHCGIASNQIIDNDSTLDILSKVALSHAESGADIVAPSAMMDGQVSAIRQALDGSGFSETEILSYSAKHSSSLYAPFRSAAFSQKSAIMDLDKSSYQVHYACPRQVLREIESDIEEGADMVMVKPGLAYLDLVAAIKDIYDFPLAVQNVSGEYAMIKAAAGMGWIDEEEWKVSSIASIRRAGADRIISYFAIDVAPYI